MRGGGGVFEVEFPRGLGNGIEDGFLKDMVVDRMEVVNRLKRSMVMVSLEGLVVCVSGWESMLLFIHCAFVFLSC